MRFIVEVDNYDLLDIKDEVFEEYRESISKMTEGKCELIMLAVSYRELYDRGFDSVKNKGDSFVLDLKRARPLYLSLFRL